MLRYRGIVLDIENKTAEMDGETLQFSKLEFELLSLFLQNPGKLYSRDRLLSLCWPENVVVLDRTVDVSIARLRKKIGHYGAHIRSRVGFGYCWEG